MTIFPLLDTGCRVNISVWPSAVIDGQYSSSVVFIALPMFTGLKGTGFLMAFSANSQLITFFWATILIFFRHACLGEINIEMDKSIGIFARFHLGHSQAEKDGLKKH